MSKIKNGGLYQYGAGPFEQQQFGTAGVEGVNSQRLKQLSHYANKQSTLVTGSGAVTQNLPFSLIVPVLITPTHKGMARLSWPRWLAVAAPRNFIWGI